MAMARDGLLPSFFSDVNKGTQVPVKSTLATGFAAAVLAFFINVSQLAGMVSAEILLSGFVLFPNVVGEQLRCYIRSSSNAKVRCSILTFHHTWCML